MIDDLRCFGLRKAVLGTRALGCLVPRYRCNSSAVASHGLEDRLIHFGTAACRLGESLPRSPLGMHVSLQLARCSTSTFANYGEVQSAESRRDFIHKLGICLKELRETRTWLKFIRDMNLSDTESVAYLLRECEELLAILAASIRTARANAARSNDQ